jgi:hypothetical protein
MRMSVTDTVLLGVLGGLYASVVGFGSVLLGRKVIETVDHTIYPRTPEYLAKEKKKELVSWIKGGHKRVQEKERVLDSFKKYKESEYQNNTVRVIKAEIEYLKRSIERCEHEKGVLDFAFCLKEEPAPSMPVEIGFRKLFYKIE